jgi:hypothetical protein
MVQVCWLDGSGAKCTPRCAVCFDRSRLSTPGSTQASRLTGSTERIRFILAVEMTMAPLGGTAPPASPVPDPRATNGTSPASLWPALTHHDHPTALDRHAVDVHLVVGADVIVE